MRAVTRSRTTGEKTEKFMVIKESHCHGFQKGRIRTLNEWMLDQEVVTYNEINDRLMQIISLKNQLIPGPLDVSSRRLFNIVLYDLDNFKSQIENYGLLDQFEVNSSLMDAALEDDVALLDLGIKWIKHVLFDQNCKVPP